MKTQSVHVILLALAAFILVSCRKEKILSSNTRILTQEAWQYHQFGIDENLDGEIDINQGFETCSLDDLFIFHSDGNGTFDQGSNLCFPGFPQTQSFNWQFHNNETQIEYGGTVHTILALDENQLAIYTEQDNGGTTVRHILIYRRV